MMFRWEPEGHYYCAKFMAIAPFWFLMKHCWTDLMPFWLSAYVMFSHVHYWLSNPAECVAITPFWFSMKYRWTALTPFWLSANVVFSHIHYWLSNPWQVLVNWSFYQAIRLHQEKGQVTQTSCRGPVDKTVVSQRRSPRFKSACYCSCDLLEGTFFA